MTAPLVRMLTDVLARRGENVSLVLITPRFRTSQNVVAVLVSRETAEPIAVAKLPREVGAGTAIEHEARILRSLEAARPGGYASVPRILGVGEWAGRPVLVQSALAGRLLDGHDVRRNANACIEEVTAWLHELPVAPPPHERREEDYERLVSTPLGDLMRLLRAHEYDVGRIGHTLELLEPLRTAALPLVFEHGDLNYPNILRLTDGTIGVIDWEIGEEQSLPGRDLFFFLAFVAIARRRARTRREELGALHEAYLGREGWARSFVRGYGERLGIDPSLLTPLFIACWARHAASWLTRLGDLPHDWTEHGDAEAAAAYIQGNLSFNFWNDVLERLDELRWDRV